LLYLLATLLFLKIVLLHLIVPAWMCVCPLLVFVFLDTLTKDYQTLYPWAPYNLSEEVSTYTSHEQIVAFMKSNLQK